MTNNNGISYKYESVSVVSKLSMITPKNKSDVLKQNLDKMDSNPLRVVRKTRVLLPSKLETSAQIFYEYFTRNFMFLRIKMLYKVTIILAYYFLIITNINNYQLLKCNKNMNKI